MLFALSDLLVALLVERGELKILLCFQLAGAEREELSGQRVCSAYRFVTRWRAGRDLKLEGTPRPRDRQPGAYVDLHRALDRVPREARVLLALHYVDGLSYGELARIRGISVNTVKSQLARGKSLLRAELAERGVL